MMSSIPGTFILVETNDRIFIHPSQLTNSSKFIVINRENDEIRISSQPQEIPDGERLRTEAINGIVGLINLIAGPYLIVVKNASQIGQFNGHYISQLKQYEIIGVKRSLLHITEKQRQFNQAYIDMLETVLSTPYFYFSTTYDLSHNLQSLNFNSPDFFNQTIFSRAESKFIWNHAILQPFSANADFHSFCLPLIHGFVSINEIQVKTETIKMILISRRSSKRPGTRLFCRGIDAEGNTSNFVETEQILEYNGEVSSFLQIRGSIPVFWSQKPNLRYKPIPRLVSANHSEAFIKHFEDLLLRYSRVVCIDLVNQSGSESTIGSLFAQQVQSASMGNVRYEAFDFHHECANMKWHRLEILTNRLSHDLEEFGYFLQLRGQRQQSQEGIFRTNCVDCLDRTNVVQGMLARLNMERVLRRFGILREHEKISDHQTLEYFFKNVWADNGDFVSIQYSGTGALKSDFTRTGKRNFHGVLRDGYNSGMRYLKNNFIDGHRQDAMDLFLGNYLVDSSEGSQIFCPLGKERDWKYYGPPLFLLFSMIMTTILAIVPSEYTTENLLYLLFWGTMFVSSGGFIFSQGREYVDNPVLCASRNEELN